MTQLDDFSLDQLAGAIALGLSSVGGLMMILFKSRCVSVEQSCCWGLFKYRCSRQPPPEADSETDEEEGMAATATAPVAAAAPAAAPANAVVGV